MPAISLAYEKAERDIMLRPPRNPLRDRLVNRKLYFLAYGNLGMLETLGLFLVYFLVMAEHGFLPSTLFGKQVHTFVFYFPSEYEEIGLSFPSVCRPDFYWTDNLRKY